MASWKDFKDHNGPHYPENMNGNGLSHLSAEIPRSSLAPPIKALREKDKNTELQTQFSSRSSNADSRLMRKPPLNPRPPEALSSAAALIPDSGFTKFQTNDSQIPSKPSSALNSRSASPKQYSPASSPVGGIPSWAAMLDHQASQRVGPQLGDPSWKNNTWSLEKSIGRTVNLRDSDLIFVSKQIIVCVRHNAIPIDRDSQRLATISSAVLWGSSAELKTDPASLQALSSVGQETADYMSAEFRGRYSVILSTPELAQILWDGPIHLVQESPFEPAPLQESVMLLLHLERYLISSPNNVVLFFQGNLAVIAALICLQDPGAMNCDSGALLADLCALRKENLPVAGARRYLAMLDACMNSPELIESYPRMVVTSLRLFGDHEFVRSSETLIRVHAELHHSGVIDSTDYREQMCYRITRGSDAEACLVVSFLPIKLSVGPTHTPVTAVAVHPAAFALHSAKRRADRDGRGGRGTCV